MIRVAALECRAVQKSYGNGRVVLAHLDFVLGAGEYIAIMGESGVGKSTLLNLIAGLDTPDAGSVLIDGVTMSDMSDDEATRLRREKIGKSRFVLQNHAAWPRAVPQTGLRFNFNIFAPCPSQNRTNLSQQHLTAGSPIGCEFGGL